jgi:hypothetical protein
MADKGFGRRRDRRVAFLPDPKRCKQKFPSMPSAVETETRTSAGIASTAPWVGMTVSSSSVRSIDSVTSVIFMDLAP